MADWSGEKIGFYEADKPYGCFSNLSPHPVLLDGYLWPTSEHYYQSRKFEEKEYQELILNLEDPIDAWRLTRKMADKVRPDWDMIKEAVMKKVLTAKALQHKSIWQTLRETGSMTLVEEADDDPYWGTGEDGKGKNRLGILWMEVRDALPDTFEEG
ncbi:MAG: NADAR family protein [Bacteroidia bacterium]